MLFMGRSWKSTSPFFCITSNLYSWPEEGYCRNPAGVTTNLILLVIRRISLTFLRPCGSKRFSLTFFGAKKEAKKHPP